MKDKIKLIIAQILNLGIEEINDDASTSNLPEWDSLKHMNIIFAVEEQLEITFEDDEIMELNSLQKIVNALQKRNS
jgi:acyl carrier protein